MGLIVVLSSLVALIGLNIILWKLVRHRKAPFGSGFVDIKKGPLAYICVFIMVLAFDLYFSYVVYQTIISTDWSSVSGGPCGIYCGQ